MRNVLFLGLCAVMMVTVACTDNSRRQEIEQRKAALRHKQDSTLLASQQELAWVDSALVATKAEYERMKVEVEKHKVELRATADELTALTRLRVKRDSLQVQWDVLGAKIKYIRLKQAEMDSSTEEASPAEE